MRALRGSHRDGRAGWRCLAIALALTVLAGCASQPPPQDPLINVNRKTYAMNEFLDGNAFEPVARAYTRVMPDPAERAVPRFFQNLNAGDRFAGALLQGKVKSSSIVLGRFVINSTVGVLGLFDAAQAVGLERQNEDIGQALESWGLTGSPYLMLPFLGPTTAVELPDWAMLWILPRLLLGDYWNLGLQALELISARAEALDTTELVDRHAIDGYAFVRDSYLQRRRSLLHDGELPEQDPFLVPSEGTSESSPDHPQAGDGDDR